MDFDYYILKIISDLLWYFFWFLAWFLSYKYYFKKNLKINQFNDSEQKMFYYLWILAWAMFFAIIVSSFDNYVSGYFSENFWNNFVLSKTIAWAIAGWVISSEIIKKVYKLKFNTWVVFVPSLIVWTIIWRIWAFLIWLRDNTHGLETTIAWWFDYWDWILRHPAQIYEIIVLLIIWIIFVLWLKYKKSFFLKNWFFIFCLFYFIYRFLVGFIMPYSHFWFWINTIQVVSIWMIFYAIYKLRINYGK